MVETIATPDDPRVSAFAAIRSASSVRPSTVFVLEGRQAVVNALGNSRFSVRALLLNRAAHAALELLLAAHPDVPCYVASQECLNQIVGFDLHRGCVGLADRGIPLDLTRFLDGQRHLVVLESVGNPDNVGGIFRNAAAFGLDGVLLSPGCADPLYPKAIRASAAASLTVPFASAAPWPEVLETLKRRELFVLGLTPAASAPALETIMPTLHEKRVAVLVGAESTGLSARASAAADRLVRIPMAPPVDSLNVAVATGIVLSRLFENGRR